MYIDQNTVNISMVQEGTDGYVTTNHKGISHVIPCKNK